MQTQDSTNNTTDIAVQEVKTETQSQPTNQVVNSTESNFGLFAKRAGAYIIDTIITSIVYAVIGVLLILVVSLTVNFGAAVGSDMSNDSTMMVNSSETLSDSESALFAGAAGVSIGIFVIYIIIIIMIDAVYYSYFESSKYQATPGKQILGLKVVREDMTKLSFKTALLRYIIELVSASIATPFIYLISLLTDKKQTIHDLVAKTIVVKK